MQASTASDAAVQPAPAETTCAEERRAAWPVAVLILGGALVLYAAVGFGLYELFVALQ